MKNIIATFALVISMPSMAGTTQTGLASWYGDRFAGRATASGEIFNPDAMTAAHKTLPFGTVVDVTYKGKTTTVRINDRGPFVHGRIIDLSRAAAQDIGLYRDGVGKVVLSYS